MLRRKTTTVLPRSEYSAAENEGGGIQKEWYLACAKMHVAWDRKQVSEVEGVVYAVDAS
jgi:hypothetical protein